MNSKRRDAGDLGRAPTEADDALDDAALEGVGPDWTTGLWILVSYLAAIAWGCVGLLSPSTWPAGQELAADRAVFTVINAATLTGFAQTRGVQSMLPVGQWMVAGLVLAGALVTLWGGGWAVSSITGMGRRGRDVGIAAVGLILAAAGAGALFLSGDRNVLCGAFNGVAALSNCGMMLGAAARPTDVTTHAVRLPLAILGGLGVAVVLDLMGALRGRRLSRQTRSVLVGASVVYLIGTVVLAAIMLGGAKLGATLASASAWCLGARTAGFLTTLSTVPRAGQWFILGLMAVGASTGGTGGGIKSNTFVVLARGVRDIWHGIVPQRVVAIAAGWLAAYVVIAGGCVLGLMALTSDLPPDRLLFLSISAASNVGLCYDPVSITGPGLWVLSVTMLVGRIAPLLVIWWVWRAQPESELVVG